MNTETTQGRKIHYGRNVKRWREILNIKQETLAEGLGLSQQSISRLELQEKIDDDTLDKIAKEMDVPVDVIKNFDEERAINIVSSTFHNEAGGYISHYKCTFNPLEKLEELYECQNYQRKGRKDWFIRAVVEGEKM